MPQLFLSETVAREVTSSVGNSFFSTVTLTLRSLRTEKAEKKGEELPSLSLPVLSPFSHPFSREENRILQILSAPPLSPIVG